MDKGEFMNIAVIKLRDLIKYLFCFIIIIAIISVVLSGITKKEELKEQERNLSWNKEFFFFAFFENGTSNNCKSR